MNFEQLENGTASQRKSIILRSVYGKQQGTLDLYPMIDIISGRLKGVKELSDEEKRNAVRVVGDETSRRIFDGFTLNLENETDNTDWSWLKHCVEIAHSFEDAQESSNALFYIEDIEGETEKKISKRDLIFKAMEIINGASEFKRSEFMRLLGQRSEYFTPLQIKDYLSERSFDRPEDIIRIAEDRDYKTRLFFYKLIDNKIIHFAGGVYKYENIALGSTVEQCIIWLKERENYDLVKSFTLMLSPSLDEADAESKAVAKKK